MSLRAYAQLGRLPNLPTALADITLGALATAETGRLTAGWWGAFACLLAASACLYVAGMVWNDYFDVEEDARDRPERPIPSGRVSRAAAGRFGAVLMVLGVGFASLAGYLLKLDGRTSGTFLPGALAGLLVAAILLYDSWLKHTPLGPVAMGTCRLLNVLLGVSVSGSLAWPLGPHLALVVGLYIVGVTWFARTEARTSSRNALTGAAAVMLASLLLALPLPVHREPGTASVLFPYLLVTLGFVLGFPLWRAIGNPTPGHVQAGVKRSLMALILLDAVLATAVAGAIGLVVLVLMGPSLYLNRKRWLYAT